MSTLPRLLRIPAGSGLGVAIVAAFLAFGSRDAVAANAPVRPSPAAAKPALAPQNPDALVEEILDQPLFSPSRQPADAAEPEQVSEAQKTPPKMPGRLAGMTIRPEMREALFEREGEKPVAVKEGQAIDGWTVASIQPDQVVLRSAAGEQILKPTNAAGIKPPQLATANKKPAVAPKKPGVARAGAGPAQPRAPTVQQTQRPAAPTARGAP